MQQQEEGVLKDVLDELDRERTRRAELELQVQQLELETNRLSQRLQRTDEVSYGTFMALQAEVEGYRDIINALTLGKPAIAAAAQAEHVQDATQHKQQQQQSSHSPIVKQTKKDTPKTLPLHIVRLLEVLPWEDRAKQHVIVVEQIYEWQVHKEGSWQSHLKYFPTSFKTLRSHNADSNSNALLQMLSGAELHKRNKQRILTDEGITILYDTDSGFPLPTDGGVWEWIGSWGVVRNDEGEKQLPADANGWSYVENPRDFLNHDTAETVVFGDPGTNADITHKGKTAPRPFRRRRWVRQRNLVEYPFASESTKEYLRILAENARLQIVTSKINEQLIDTKATLTEAEERLVKAKNDTVDGSMPSAEAMEEQEDTKQLEKELVGGESSSTRTPVFERNPMDKISMWVQQQSARKASEDITLSDDSGTEDGLGTDSTHSDSTRSTASPFDWKKLGRHQIMQKLKRTHGSSRRVKTFRAPVLDTPEEDDLML